ncbi:hypothetical protein Hanom_Chr07g00586721 [Helianthus anomalus]
MLSGPDDVRYMLFCRCSAMWLLAVVLMDMYVVPTLLRALIGNYGALLPSVATPVVAMVTLTRALLAMMMMTRDVQMGLICNMFKLLGVVQCASIVFCALIGCTLCDAVVGYGFDEHIWCSCLSGLIGVYGGLLPGVATPVAATVTLTRALLLKMMTQDVHLSLFMLQRL